LIGCAQVQAPTLAGLNPFGHRQDRPAPAGATASAPDAQRANEARARRRWTQDGSDVPADPAVRFGVLPNGMRYMLMHNASPPGQASLRLRIAAGSLEERDEQAGLMHFIEHMAFNGSTHVPEGEMVKILERKGLAFGPDTNAFTSFDQTVYQLDLPQADEDSLDTGLMLMRETAGELLLDPAAIEKERGVVLSEERLRDGPSMRIARQQYDFFYRGDRVPRRFPIGDIGVLKTAGKPLFQDLYDTFYRPDRAVLVAVGDFDVDKMEAKIKARFTDWNAKGPDRPDPDLGPVVQRGAETRLVIEPGGPAALNLAWITQPDLRQDRLALRRERAQRQVGFAVLNRRLERLGRAEHPPYLSASAGSSDLLKSAHLTAFSVESAPGEWRPALDAVVAEQRRIVEFGVGREELDREITETRTTLQNAAAAASTRRTPQLADGLVLSVNGDRVFTTPAENLAVFEQAVKGLDTKTVDAAVREAFQGDGPLLSITSPAPIEGGQAAVEAEFAKARSAQVTQGAVQQTKTWPYADFGPAGKVVERREVADLGVTFVRFANGVRLTVKPTAYRKEQILIAARIADGRLDLPRDRVTSAWAASAYVQGGLKDLSQDEIERVLASRTYRASFGIGEDAFVMGGSTKPADLNLQMQILTAYLTKPGWRPAAFERIRNSTGAALDQIEATSQGVLAETLQTALHPNDPRYLLLPTREQTKSASMEDLKALVTGPLATGPIEIVVVGDVTVDQAIASVAPTFGALPTRAATGPAPKNARVITLPQPTKKPIEAHHHGRADQAVAFVAWPTSDTYADLHRTRVLDLTGRILARRLVDQIRIVEGATYSPQAQSSSSSVFPGYGLMIATVETPPAKIPNFFANVSKITGDMATKGVTADELDRARKPEVEAIGKRRETNDYWLGRLAGAQLDPRRLTYIRTEASDLDKVTPDEVRKAAQTYLKDDRALQVQVVPVAAPAAVPAPAAPAAPKSQ
jgi:zinc protease